MKTIHLVAPRTGPDNAGGAVCVECEATVFETGGALAYNPGTTAHTTDPATYFAAGTDEMPDYKRCTEKA